MHREKAERKGGSHDRFKIDAAESGGKDEGAWRMVRDTCGNDGEVDERPGHNRVRHSGRRVGGYRNPGHHGVQAKTPRTMERDRRWNKRSIAYLANAHGQSTVEFAVIAAGFMSLAVALSAIWHFLDGGLLVEHALAVASHHIQMVAPATIPDIFLY